MLCVCVFEYSLFSFKFQMQRRKKRIQRAKKAKKAKEKTMADQQQQQPQTRIVQGEKNGGLPPLKPGEKYVKGSEMFKDQLKRVPQRVLSHDELRNYFYPLFDDIRDANEKNLYKSGAELMNALAEKHVVCAYGYPMVYTKACLGELSKVQFEALLNTPESQ